MDVPNQIKREQKVVRTYPSHYEGCTNPLADALSQGYLVKHISKFSTPHGYGNEYILEKEINQ